ncbi:putative inorganic phosphate cotransporter isoform X1 [Anoplophora glabripennis]|uniref:putative inorganic phosphate cotransporter isoform X1 n=1 Tax=Anoplophora glabripennis TaxID=217634 RepID=UPI000873C9DE|nr:putative inorganic phosphate cotransporter isoform X1 [Anoplophora glabripennis]
MAKENPNMEMKTVQNGKGGEKFSDELTKEEKSNGPSFGKRHTQILIYFLLIFIAYGIRVNLSVGIVAMTDPTASSNPDVPTYNWTDKSVMLSAFFWGYVLPQVGAGWLANTYGPKWFLISAMAVCSLFGLLLPSMAAMFGSKGVMASRAIQGLCQGFIFPSTHNLLAQWVPPNERSRLGTFVYAAGPFGTVVSMLVTGLISSSWYGWPLVFYLYGVAGLLWSVIFTFFGYNGPSFHPTITEEEKFYIESSLGHSDDKRKLPTPWKKILTSAPVWAILLTQCGHNWGFWTLLTEIPVYMSHVMNFNIKSNSVLSALPYFVLWVLSFVFSVTADMLVNKNLFSIGTSRKFFNTIGLVVPAIALVCLGNTGSEETNKAIVLLVVAVGINSAVFCGFNVNHMDISPNFTGTLMGITNGTSNIFGIVAPLLVQFLVTDEKDPNQWKVIFYMTSSIYVLASVIFIIFGSGEVQSWNDEENNKDKEKSQA